MKRESKIYVAGHGGLVGSAIHRRLQKERYANLIARTHAELDLERQAEVEAFFQEERPEYVFLAAAKVGGIWANDTFPADFIHKNLTIQANVIHAAWKVGVRRLLFMGSSCVYPRECPQPMHEAYLLTSPLEPTNQPYAVAKIAGIIQCQAYNRQYRTQFLAVMPTNLYGPNDNFDLQTSHVLPALIRKFHLAKLAARMDWDAIERDEACFGRIPEDLRISLGVSSRNRQSSIVNRQSVTLWGTGTPRREFLHVDDLAEACVFLMTLEDQTFGDLCRGKLPEQGTGASCFTPHTSLPLINIGLGEDSTVGELAGMVAKIVGYDGDLVFDRSKPDGTPRKLLDVSRLRSLGWSPKISLGEGIERTYEWYLKVSNS